jgi:hypothetical protein
MTDEKTIAEPSGASGGSMAWIPVTERLPSTRCRVLVVWGLTGHITMAWFRPEKKRKRFLYEVDGFNDMRDSQSFITHWMPLPDAPTDAK